MRRINGWLEMLGRRGWQVAGVALAAWLAGIVLQRVVVLVLGVFLALVLTVLLAPVARWLEARGLPGSVAAGLALLGAAVVGATTLGLAIGQLALEVPELRDEYDAVVRDVRTWLVDGPLQMTQREIDDLAARAMERLRGSWQQVASRSLAVLSGVGAGLTAAVLTFFLLRDGDQMRRWALQRLVAPAQHAVVRAAGRRVVQAFRGYVRAVVVIGALDAIFIGVGLLVIGVPLAPALAVLTFIGGFFPVVGATVVGLLATLVAGVSGGVGDAVAVGVLVVVVQQLDGNVLQPVVMGEATDLHPAAVLLVLTLGGLVGGLPGALLAVPATAVAVAAAAAVREHDEQTAVLADRADHVGAESAAAAV